MGAWSASITGNDTAQDLKNEYKAAFYYFDTDTALEKIEHYVRAVGFSEDDPEEWCDYYYSLADFMWRKGILTEKVKETAIEMIDSDFGLELWAEEGKVMLNKRKKELEKFRAKLMSELPPRKKIKLDLYMTPLFNKGDIIALQLKTEDKYYLPEKISFSEEFFRECDGKWVAVRKLWDQVNHVSSIVPEVVDIWPKFQLYGKIFDECPKPEDLAGVGWAKSKFGRQGVYGTEGSMFYFKKRNARVIGSDTDKIEEACDISNYNINDTFYFGINTYFYNADTRIINAIV